MGKKGLTLVELLAVVAIIGILSIMITPGIISIRNNVLESTYRTRVSQIENAAKEYATDHINLIPSNIPDSAVLSENDLKNETYRSSCPTDYSATISVNYLISSGYISGTNSYTTSDGQVKENQIINPKTGETMNNMVVCMRFSSRDAMKRELLAYLLEE